MTFDPFEAVADPVTAFAAARADSPVFHCEEIDHWVVTRHADVKAILLDVDGFSATNTITPITPLGAEARRILAEGDWRIARALGNNDPPDHTRFRRNVQLAFTPRRIALQEPFVRETVVSTLEPLIARGHAELMGELLASLLGNAVHQLLRHRDAWDALCADPTLAEPTVEEVLRYDSPVITWRRLARRATEIGGATIPAGAQVLLAIAAANHDEAVFDDPGRFAPGRADARRHLSFGHGIHHCLGASLARLEGRVTLEELSARLPGLRLAQDGIDVVPNTTFRGPLELLVEWDANTTKTKGP